MSRYKAGQALKANRYLHLSERVVFLVLLDSAHNITCEIEAKYAPNSREELADWAGLSTRQLQRAVRHLEHHGWLQTERGAGRGQKTRYRLLPRVPDIACGCPKGDTVSPIRTAQKGDTMSEEGGHGVRERETWRSPSEQVKPAIGTRTQGLGVVALACDKCESTDTQIIGAYRLCRTHAGPTWKEPAA